MSGKNQVSAVAVENRPKALDVGYLGLREAAGELYRNARHTELIQEGATRFQTALDPVGG